MINKNWFITPALLSGISAFFFSIVLFFFKTELVLLPLVVFIILCLVFPFITRFGFFLPVISHGNSGENAVALTFDDGPDPNSTIDLLNILSEYSVKATFFVIGEKVHKYPDLIREIISNGHTIGNHSYTHDYLLMLRSNKRLKSEVRNTQSAIMNFGIKTKVFRPPVGITNPRLGKVLHETDLNCVTYNCQAFDKGNKRISRLSQKILKKVKPGDIILLHDVGFDDETEHNYWLHEIMSLLKGLKKKGLEIKTLSELIGMDVMVNKREDGRQMTEDRHKRRISNIEQGI